METIEAQKIEDKLLLASELSYSYRNQLLLILDDEEETLQKAEREYRLDPEYSAKIDKACLLNHSCIPTAVEATVVKIFGSINRCQRTLSGYSGSDLATLMLRPALRSAHLFSLDVNVSATLKFNFMKTFQFRGVTPVLEISNENYHTYQVLDQRDTLVEYESPKRPVDHTTQYDWQNILIMEDDPVVRESATFLYEKHPMVSSVYRLENREPKLIKGPPVPLSQDSRLVIVGHGVKMEEGITMGGHKAQEVAEIISHMGRDGDQIKTISVAACECGADETFMTTLIKELHGRSIETKLHFRSSLLQVTHDGRKITWEHTPNGFVGKHQDHTKKVVVQLGNNGEVIMQEQSDYGGGEFFSDQPNFLMLGDQKEWPKEPERFVDANARQPHTDILEALAWGFFPEGQTDTLMQKLNRPRTTPEDRFVIYDLQFQNERDRMPGQWINTPEKMNEVLQNSYEIKSGEDIVNIITHYASFGESSVSYLIVNDWIYHVSGESLYVYPVGKRLSNNEKADDLKIEYIKAVIELTADKEQYSFMRDYINHFKMGREKYADYARKNVRGEYLKGTFEPNEELWYTTYFTASVISESSRNLRTFPAVLMAVHLTESGDVKIKEMAHTFLLENHPMAAGGTWVLPQRRGYYGSSTAEPLATRSLKNQQKNLLKIVTKEEAICQTFFNNVQNVPDWEVHLYGMVKQTGFDTFISNVKHALDVFSHPPKRPQVLGGSYDSEVTEQDVNSATEVEHSLKLSSYHSQLSNKLPEHIEKQLKEDFGEKFREFHIKPDSVRYENGEIHCQLISDSPSQEIQWKMTVPKEERFHLEKIGENIKDVSEMKISEPANIHRTPENIERMGKAVGTVGLIVGIQGAVHAFERGDTLNGVIGTLQTAHGITEMSLAAVAKASVTSELKVMKTAKTFIESPAGKKSLQILPIAGIGFGIYNVEEDFKRKDTLGYIDGALDSSVLAIDVIEAVQPELAPLLTPVNLGLSVLRMVADDVYMGIQDELESLPEDAGILEKIGAVTAGLLKGVAHFTLDVASFFYTIPYQEIEEGHKLVEHIADYHQYYKLHEVQAGTKAIDFSSGGASWNAGNITFFLHEAQSKLCMDDFVSSNEELGKKCWDVETDQTKDIVLGTGESHELTYSQIQLKVLLFIPAGHKTVVSGYKVLSHTRFGTYYGNDQGNHFFAVQTNEDSQLMEVMLSYYYKLYGDDGDDTFYLGPQRSNVEGQGGTDSYIIPKTGGNTNINNYDPDRAPDALIFSANYSDISVTKSGDDVILHYFTHYKVRLLNWFVGEQFRHINLLSADGVLFEIAPIVVSSVELIARGVNKMSEKTGQKVNASEPLLDSVNNIMGSPYNDHLIGNKEKNVIDGGGGVDYVKGGEGEDMYMVKERQNSRIQIENHSHDNENDMVIIEADFHSFKMKVDGDNVILMPFKDMSSDVTLRNWFRSEADRHLVVLTKDLITFTISANKDLCKQPDLFQSKCILSQSIDYRTSQSPLLVDLRNDDAFQNVTQIYGSDFNDNIVGNANRNTIIPGKGNDFVQGLEGEDWYVVTPGHGLKTIDNHSPDLAQDTLFLRERYELLDCKCKEDGISILINGRKEVILKNWFDSPKSQHLQVQSLDGVTFHLIQNRNQCGGTLKIPFSVDHRNDQKGQNMLMDQKEFASVVEMYGSAGFDMMVGNEEDNTLDSYTGGGRMRGGNGSDTYVVKHERGAKIEIDNSAHDGKIDTVLFDANFLHDQITVQAEQYDVLVNTLRKGYEAQIRLLNYRRAEHNQHLTFQSNDGVFFRVRSPVSTIDKQSPWLEAYRVKLPDNHADCRIDLGYQGNLSSVHTVQGCPQQSNHILGNKLDNALFGGVKDDGLEGGPGHDTLMGGKGEDILMGNSGDDTLYGGEGDDMMLGGSGADSFIPGPGADEVDGGPGRDTVLYEGDHKKGEGVYVNLLTGEGLQADAEGDVLKDIENVIGTIYSDILISGYEPTLLKGSDGDDVLVSVVGEDYLIGGEGKDIYLLISRHGLLTIDNCAEDDAPDVLYLPFLSMYTVSCSQKPDWLSLTFGRRKSLAVEVRLMDWHNSTHKCGHVTLILQEGAKSMEDVC
ncbi:hypothetical protein ACEWY4_014962 [Coilia grayii]|uniref:Peptidase C80 domain-containing protein n=1 Tax=Coilia grayii TaxID=363190 RepID=A0ABD1JTU4_9TELE